MGETFCKEERLYLKRDFEAVFEDNNYFIVRPLKIYWKELPGKAKYPVKFGVSAPKRIVPNASDRNKIKRRLREIYRRNKQLLYNNNNEKSVLLILAVYTAAGLTKHDKLKESLLNGLQKIKNRNE